MGTVMKYDVCCLFVCVVGFGLGFCLFVCFLIWCNVVVILSGTELLYCKVFLCGIWFFAQRTLYHFNEQN